LPPSLAPRVFPPPPPPPPVSATHLRRTLQRLGLVQIDYVNVLVPAHYLVLYSRLGPYDLSLLHEVVYRRRDFTEQWAHEASIVPVATWPLLRHRMEVHRVRPYGFETFLKKQPAYVDWVVAQVRARGPLTADDLADQAHELAEDLRLAIARRIEGAWHGSVPRAVLEAHFGRGVLAVAERRANFARVYDLVERVLPAEHHSHVVEREEAQRELLLLAARAHGIGTAADLADYYRMPVSQARPRLTELLAAGKLHAVQVEGWREPAYLHPEARLPRRIGAAALLAPFDPVIWYRPRAARLFNFDYRVEIFVPKPKRKWGYYVLPFLLGDRIVARVDLRAERTERRLLVPAAYLEPGTDPGAVAAALATELRLLARWLHLDSISVERRGNFARPLAAAVRA
jgi:uncharacterized protein